MLVPSASAGLVGNGIDPRIATYAASQYYKTLQGINGPMYNSFVSWMAKHGSAHYLNIATAQNRRIAIRNSGRDFPGNQ